MLHQPRMDEPSKIRKNSRKRMTPRRRLLEPTRKEK